MGKLGNDPTRNTEREVIDSFRKLGYGTSYSIAVHMGLSHKWIEDKIRVLKDANRLYVCHWEKKAIAGDWRPVYALRRDDEEDEPKPIAKTDYERAKAWRNRTKLKELILNGSITSGR